MNNTEGKMLDFAGLHWIGFDLNMIKNHKILLLLRVCLSEPQ